MVLKATDRSSRYRLPLLAAGLLVLVSGCLGGGGGSGESALLVKPGESVEVSLGSNTFGVDGAFTEIETLSGYRGGGIAGRTEIEGSRANFKYAKFIGSDIKNVFKVSIRSPSNNSIIPLRTFVALSPLTVDYSTERTVSFFHEILKRDPEDLDEILFVLSRLRKTVQDSCMVGRSLPDIGSALRVMDVALIGSQSYFEIVDEFELSNSQKLKLATFNSGPRIMQGTPYPALVGTTNFNLNENTVFNLTTRVVDADRDYYYSEWYVDGEPLEKFPFLEDLRESLPNIPEGFQAPAGLKISTDYTMSQTGESRVFDLELRMCDGGPLVRYPYKLTVNDTNRNPEFTVYPTSTEELTAGVEHVFVVKARDIDGDKMSFGFTSSATENILFAPVGNFASAKTYQGNFVLDTNLRESLPSSQPYWITNPWMDGSRGPASKIPVPSRIEFYASAGSGPSDRAKVKGLNPSDPQAVQDVPVEFSFQNDPVNGRPSTLQFALGKPETNEGLKLFRPLALNNAQMKCIAQDVGYQVAYSMTIACDMDRFPLNFEKDGVWGFTMKCPLASEAPTSANNRCRPSEGLALTPDNAPISEAEMKIAVRMERFQETTGVINVPVLVFDGQGGSAAISLSMRLPQSPLPPVSRWKDLAVFEHFQWPAGETAPHTSFSNNTSPNYAVSFNLKDPYTRWDMLGGTRDIFAEPPGSLLKEATRGGGLFRKKHWWQNVRWEQREDSSSPDSIFTGTPFLAFLGAGSESPDLKLLLSRDKSSSRRLWIHNNYNEQNLQNHVDSLIYKYEVLSSSNHLFEFKVINGVSYRQDLYCEARLNFTRSSVFPNPPSANVAPISSDWQLRCDQTLAAARASSDYYRYDPGARMLISDTSSPSIFDHAVDPQQPAWYLSRCAVGENSSDNAGKSCVFSSSNQVKSIFTYFSAKPMVLGLTPSSQFDRTKFDVYDPEASLFNDPELVDFPVNVGALSRTASLYPVSQRLVFNDTSMGAYRWCRYGLRSRMTSLVLTCSRVQPTLNLAMNYPNLYQWTTNSDFITLEFAYTTLVEKQTGPLPRIKTFLGLPKVALNKTFADPSGSNQAQTLSDDVFQLPGLKQALMAFKLSYDESMWASSRKENHAPRPRLKSYTITAITTGAGGGETLITNNPLSIWNLKPDEASETLDGYNATSQSIDQNLVGHTTLKRNEFLVAWRPTNPGTYRLDFVLEQKTGETSFEERPMSLMVSVKEFVYPPSLIIKDKDLSYTTAGVSEGRTDEFLGLFYNNYPRYTPGQQTMYLTIASKKAHYLKSADLTKRILSDLVVTSNLATVSAFWLTEKVLDASSNTWKERLVDPDDETRATPWYLEWPLPFDNTTSIGTHQKFISKRVSGYEEGPTDALLPGVVLDGMNRDYSIKKSNISSALFSGAAYFNAGASGHLDETLPLASMMPLRLEVDPKSPPVKDVTKLRIAGQEFFVDVIKQATTTVITDLDTATDIRIRDINISNLSTQVASHATCRILKKYPVAGLKDVPLLTKMKLFCIAGAHPAFDPTLAESSNTMPTMETEVSASEPAASTGIYALEALTSFQLPSASHSLRSLAGGATAFSQIPGSTSYSGVLGSFAWGDATTKKLLPAEKYASFSAVLVVTDGFNIIYQPVSFSSSATEEPGSASTTIGAAGLPSCSDNYTLVQRASPEASSDAIECVLPARTHPEGLLHYTVLPTAEGIGPAFSRENPSNISGLLQKLVVDGSASKWDTYPQGPFAVGEEDYRPKIEMRNLAGSWRWVFRWKIPSLARNKIADRNVTFGFSPAMDFQRKLFATSAHTHFGGGERMGPGLRKPASVSGLRDFLWYGGNEATPLLPADAPAKFTVYIQEPNIAPCVLTNPDLAGTSVGGECPTRDTLIANLNKDYGGKPAVRVISPTLGTPAENATNTLETELQYNLIPQADGNYAPLYEGDTAEVLIYAFDQNLSSSPIRNLAGWGEFTGTSTNRPSISAVTSSVLTNKPWLSGGRVRYTPQDRDILKLEALGDLQKFSTTISDGGSSGNPSADVKYTLNFRVWDKNNPPAPSVPSPGSVRHLGTNGTRSFSFTVSDPDQYDNVRVTYLGASTDVVGSVAIGQTLTPVLLPDGKYRIDFNFQDGAALQSAPNLSFYFKVEDVPWWKDNGRGIGTAYRTNHPAYNAGTGKNPMLDPSDAQVVAVTSSLNATASLLGTNRARKLYLSQTWVEPLVVNNPQKQPVTCTIKKLPRLQIQVPNPNFGKGTPPDPNPFVLVNSTDLPTLRTVNKSELLLPETTACVVVWKPTTAGWVSSFSAERLMRVEVKVGTQVLTTEWTFDFSDYLQPANNPRPPLLGVDLVAEDSVSLADASPSHTESGVPVYTISDSKGLKFSLDGLDPSYLQYGLTWYLDGVPIASNVRDWIYKPLLTESGSHDIALHLRDASALKINQLPFESEAGYIFFRAKVFVRNTRPLPPALLTHLTDYVRLDPGPPTTPADTRVMRVQSLMSLGQGYMAGVANKVTKNAQDSFAAFPFMAKIGTRELPGSMLALGPTIGFNIGESAVSDNSSRASTAEILFGSGPDTTSPVRYRSIFRFNINPMKFDSSPTPGMDHRTLLKPRLMRSDTRTSDAVTAGLVAQIDHSNANSLDLRDRASGSSVTTPWNSTFTFFSSLAPTKTGGLVMRARESAESASAFYLIPHVTDDTTPIRLNLGIEPLQGGAIWVAPCLQASCNSDEVEIAAVVLNSGHLEKNFVHGVLNTQTGAFQNRTQADVVLPLSSLAFSGAKPIQHLGHLFGSHRSATAPGDNVFVILLEGLSTYIAVDLEDSRFEIFGLPRGALSTLNCENDTGYCVVGDTGNEGLVILK